MNQFHIQLECSSGTDSLSESNSLGMFDKLLMIKLWTAWSFLSSPDIERSRDWLTLDLSSSFSSSEIYITLHPALRFYLTSSLRSKLSLLTGSLMNPDFFFVALVNSVEACQWPFCSDFIQSFSSYNFSIYFCKYSFCRLTCAVPSINCFYY